MAFKYSICHPEKQDIEYCGNPISADKVLELARKHEWLNLLHFSNSLNEDQIHYSPSLDFTHLENGRSFCLTAGFGKNKELEFSLWYHRPKKIKVLFGLLGKEERMVTDDYWSVSFEEAMNYLRFFVDEDYSAIEQLYSK